MNFNLLSATCLTALMWLSGGSTAHAADQKQTTGLACKAMNPADEGKLRYSATGVVNISASSVYVSCPLPSDADALYAPAGATYALLDYKFGGTPGKINCTLYTGDDHWGVSSSAQSYTAAAGGASGSLIWYRATGALVQAEPWSQHAINCSVPKGLKIGMLYIQNMEATQ